MNGQMDRQADEWTGYRQTNRPTDEQTNGPIDEWIDGWTAGWNNLLIDLPT